MSAQQTWTYSDKPLPIVPSFKAPEWATWIEGRYPGFKVHAHLGHAKNAIGAAGHGILYRYVGVWMLVAIVDSGQASTHPALRAGVIPQYEIEEMP